MQYLVNAALASQLTLPTRPTTASTGLFLDGPDKSFGANRNGLAQSLRHRWINSVRQPIANVPSVNCPHQKTHHVSRYPGETRGTIRFPDCFAVV
jgi:hypothetical protein